MLPSPQEVMCSVSHCRESKRTLAGVISTLRYFRTVCFPLALTLTCLPLAAQREPVLKQVDLPHRYYYREMYLPQLTTGPSSVAWSSDSKTLVYSMAGTLWRQSLSSSTAEQLTAGPGYDYQPDCSSNGRWIVYVTYFRDAMELWVLDLQTQRFRQLTFGSAVNVEPRFSPDGHRIAFVSTSYHGHFHIFVGEFKDGELTNVQRLTGETETDLPRFYYSKFDHEINPSWSPDGTELIFVSNRNHIYGAGGFWRMKAEAGAEAHEIHYEETAWKARPDFSPDGKRIVYASYLGRQWHQLWTMPANGGDPFPLSYGDFDNTNPRWSPDGKRIALISNRTGDTSLWTLEVPGGAQRQVVAAHRRYLHAMGHLRITVLDPSGRITPARISVTGEDARAYAPDDAWMHAEDNFVRAESAFESHYFHSSGNAELTVPLGRLQVELMNGFEYRVVRKTILSGAHARLIVHFDPLPVPSKMNTMWASADLHVHMNYGGTYRNTPANLVAQAAAENLFLVENLVVNKEQRVPDIAYFRTTPDPASTAGHWLLHGQEFHTPDWGHLGLLDLTQNFLLPAYASYSNTSAASLFPTNAIVADLAHQQQALVGYVHPFDIAIDPAKDPTLTNGEPLDEALELPVDVALGKVDYIEALGFSDHHLTASIWYRLLNCGFRLPAGAGSDTMANYASLRGPVGLTRVYAQIPERSRSPQQWLHALKRGHTFATNGPLLGFTLGGMGAGDELKLASGKQRVRYNAWLRSLVPVDHLAIVCNGRTVQVLKLNDDRQSANAEGTIPISQTGWCLLLAFSDKPEHPVLDDYVYATTSPIYVNLFGSSSSARDDAAFFVSWIDRLEERARSNRDWNSESEKATVLHTLDKARQVYISLQR
jgi:TolB protein